MEDNNGQNSGSYKIKRRKKAEEKRKKEQMTFTIAGIVIYSLVLVLVIAGSYAGVRVFFNNYNAKKVLEQERQEEELRAAEQKKAEEEAEAKRKLEEEQKKAEEEEAAGQYVDNVFSAIENVKDPKSAPINTYDFARKQQKADDGDKLLDYSVYRNPETKKIEKVTTREDCGDLYEITDYYYDNGVVNYIAQYKEDVDVPIDISGANVESRCYFNNKKMVRYIYCENGKAIEYLREDTDTYSDGTKEQYFYIEEMMLSLSENAYDKAENLQEEVTISGFVLDDYNQVLKDNYVALIDENTGRIMDETQTNGDGYYEFNVKADDNRTYMIRAERDTLLSTDVYGIKAVRGSKVIYADTIYMCNAQLDAPFPVQIFVKDADDFNKMLAGAQIRFRYGINNKTGDSFLTGILGEAGECVPQLRTGCFTAEITMDGYETCYASFVVKQDRQAEVFYATKELEEDEFKCVLSFYTTPLDLDIRAYDSYGRTLYKPVNDSVGAIAAEVIDIKNAGTDMYSLFVSNFTDITALENFSYRLSTSSAKLSVYNSDGYIGTFPVPEAHAGILWKPIEIRNGKVIPVNDYYTNVSDKSVFKAK